MTVDQSNTNPDAPAETATGAAGSGTEGETPPAWFQGWSDKFAEKVNGELAGHRKRIKAIEGVAPKPAEPKPDAPPVATGNGVSAEDVQAQVKAATEIGKLQATLPEDLQDELEEMAEGLSLAQQARMYRAAVAAHKKATPEGETPPTGPRRAKTARATTVAQRDAAPHPQTLKEYASLAKSDPKRKAALDADSTFDPGALPYR